MIVIPLTQGYTALIDDIDEDLTQYVWCIAKTKQGHFYGRRSAKVNGKWTTLMLHRVIGERIEGRQLTRKDDVDHIDNNGLCNLRSNLRVCSRMQNLRNRKIDKRNQSGFKGVTRLKHQVKPSWIATIMVERKQIYLGCFPTPEAAHAAYCEAAQKHFGEFFRAA